MIRSRSGTEAALAAPAFATFAIDAAFAAAPGNHAPTGTPVPGPLSLPEPAIQRQSRDSADNAFVIASMLLDNIGTCAGCNVDYDWKEQGCSMGAGLYPDIVYDYTPPIDQTLDIDLCSAFDNRLLHVF